MSTKWKARLAGFVPFLVYGAVVATCPWLRNLDFAVHGWAWAVFFATIIVGVVASGFVTGFVKGVTGFEFKHPVTRVILSVLGWQIGTLGFWLASVIIPGSVAISNVWAGITLIALVAAACESSDIIEERVLASDPSSGTK